jgi:hypothetical protein
VVTAVGEDSNNDELDDNVQSSAHFGSCAQGLPLDTDHFWQSHPLMEEIPVITNAKFSFVSCAANVNAMEENLLGHGQDQAGEGAADDSNAEIPSLSSSDSSSNVNTVEDGLCAQANYG